MQERLSVIIPVYNAENYLKRTIESVLSQTYSVYEILCIDDGSTDNSFSILNEYSTRDKRIKVFHKENGGSTSARKEGVAKAVGTYVTFVDSDDFIEPKMYEDMMALAVEYDADLVTSGLIRDYGTNITVENESIAPGVYYKNEIKNDILKSMIDKDHFYKSRISPHIVNMIFRAEILKEVQLNVDDRIIVGDDDAVIYPFLFKSNTIVVSGKNYYHYCIRENGSIMGVRKKNDYEAYCTLFEHLEKEFCEADEPLLGLMKQFHILKTYFLMLRFSSKILHYDGEVLYPFGKVKKDDKILLYGAGKFGVEMKSYLENEGFKIIGWVDKSANRNGIIRPKEIEILEFDYVIITVLIADAVQNIKEDLNKLGVPKQKILSVDVKMIN